MSHSSKCACIGCASGKAVPRFVPDYRESTQISHAMQLSIAAAEADISRRLFIGGLAGALSLFSSRPLLAQVSSGGKTTVSADGIVRTTLELYENGAGEEFRMVHTTYPPGVGLPVHHHPAAAHNYVLEGLAESQYVGETLKQFASGESYQDKPNDEHTIFRNPDKTAPLKYLIVYTVKKGQPFLIIP